MCLFACLPIWTPNCPNIIYWKNCPGTTALQCHIFVKSSMQLCMGLFLSCLFHWASFLSLCQFYGPNYYNFILKIWSSDRAKPLILFFFRNHGYFWPFSFLYKFWSQVPQNNEYPLGFFFFFNLFIFLISLAALGLSCGTRDFRFGVRASL